jgi:hypothetical protein
MKVLSAARRRFMKIVKDPSFFACRAEVSGDIWQVLVRLMDVHQLHGNLALTPGVPRLTAVLYARQHINKCK